jgi:phosphate transport system substrate-binding protein
MKGKRFALVLSAVTALALVTAECGGGKDDGSGGANVTGKVAISGSSTVLPISQLAAQEFHQDNPDVTISVDGPGTTDGFVLFCKGQTDVNDASRPIADEEIAACKKGGVDYIQLEVAFDGITIMTNPSNTDTTCLSKADLYSLIGAESEGFDDWSDANALDKQLGGDGSFPDEQLALVGPGQESGTWGAFIELALKEIADARGKPDDTTRQDYQSSPNDNVIIRGIEENRSSLGWVGFAYAEGAGQGVKILQVSPAIDASGQGSPDCVAPSRNTIASGTYPLSRSLYIYVNKQKAQQSEALRAFVDFYLSDPVIASGVQQAGYVDLPTDRVEKTRSTWQGFEKTA